MNSMSDGKASKVDGTLLSVSSGRDNNLLLVRLLAAIAVVYGHSYGTTGATWSEPFLRATGLGSADTAVNVFFVISGFLVSKSYLSRDLKSFVWARIIRIFPALWTSTLSLVIIVGLFFSPLGAAQFFGLRSTQSYLIHNLSMIPLVGAQTALPMAFANSKIDDFNISLWTLPYEIEMYVLLVALGLVGALRRPALIALLTASAGVLYVAGDFFPHAAIGKIPSRFIYFFFMGTTMFLFRARISVSSSWFLVACTLLSLLLLLPKNDATSHFILGATLPYIIIWLCFVPTGAIRAFNELGDYSYGTYILACPIQMYLALNAHFEHTAFYFFAALAIVLPLAAISWHAIEKPALKLKLR